METLRRPKKSLGQHFLLDASVPARMVEALAPAPGDHVVEIGPGRGALTAHLLGAGMRVTALELDRDLVTYLQGRFGADRRFTIIEADAKTFDYSLLGPSFKVAGNLPYNAATYILSRLLDFTAHIPTMVLMFQREVARRIAASPGSREWGYLSCLVQFSCAAEYLETIPPGSFRPAPKVHSGTVLLRPHPETPLEGTDRSDLFSLIGGVFSHRRKTLLNALAAAGTDLDKAALAELLSGWGIDHKRRPETFSLDEFILIWKILRWKRGRAVHQPVPEESP
jgi:16S rRNA (adenine1518-N6/adenine1519-N6)-dimethyltransferase